MSIFIPPGVLQQQVSGGGGFSGINLNPLSADLTDAGWIAVGSPPRSFDQTGVDEAANNATLVADDSGGSFEYIWRAYDNSAGDTQNWAARYFVLKDANHSETIEMHLRFDSSATGLGVDGLAVQIWTDTGESAARIDTGGNSNWTVQTYAGNSLWWEVLVDAPNTNKRYIKLGLFPAAATSLGGLNVSAQRSVTIGNVELYENTLEGDIVGGPVYTT
jgi:hypothetical protein